MEMDTIRLRGNREISWVESDEAHDLIQRLTRRAKGTSHTLIPDLVQDVFAEAKQMERTERRGLIGGGIAAVTSAVLSGALALSTIWVESVESRAAMLAFSTLFGAGSPFCALIGTVYVMRARTADTRAAEEFNRLNLIFQAAGRSLHQLNEEDKEQAMHTVESLDCDETFLNLRGLLGDHRANDLLSPLRRAKRVIEGAVP